MKKLIAGLMTAATLALPGAALAEYPEKPVRIIFPNEPGGAYYTILLAVLQQIEGTFGAPVAVQPMPGAGTAAGTKFVQEQPDDGYTLLFIHEGALQTSILGMLGFDTLTELEPLARVASTYPSVWARADAPYDDLVELAAYAKAHPGEVRTSIQTGAPSHVEMTALADSIGAGAEIRPVHIAGGGAGSRQALLAGDVDLIGDNVVGLKGMMDSGMVKPLATMGPARHPGIPDTATVTEQGFTESGAIGLNGYLWIRRSAPQEVKDHWRKVLGDALTKPEVEKALEEKLGVDIMFETGEPLEADVKRLYDARKAIIEQYKIGQK